MAKNFLNLGKETKVQIQEAQRVLNMMNINEHIHIVTKMSKVKTRRESSKVQENNNLSHTKEPLQNYQKIFQLKFCRPEWSDMTYANCQNKMSFNHSEVSSKKKKKKQKYNMI